MTEEDVLAEVQLTLEFLQSAEIEAASKGLSRLSGAIAAGKNMIMFLRNRYAKETKTDPEG